MILKDQTPTPLQLRAELDKLVRQDLLGPAGGEREEIEERNVRGRYVVGLLAPKGQSLLPDDDDGFAVDGGEDGQDGKAATAVPQTASMLPSSIGMTFTVTGEATAIHVTAKWGKYKRIRSETLPPNKKGDQLLVWQRWPKEGSAELTLRSGELDIFFPDPDNEEVSVRGICRQRHSAWTVTLFLVNAQSEPEQNKDEAWIFQPELIVTAAEDAPDSGIFIKRQLPDGLDTQNAEDRGMQMLYRREVEFSVGHGVATHAERSWLSWERATEIRTAVIPNYEVEMMESPTTDDIPLLGEAEFDMKTLAERETGGFADLLTPLIVAYDEWLTRQEAKVAASDDLDSYQTEARTALENGRETLRRIKAGITLIDDDPQAAEAFRFANRAMWTQRTRSIYASQARQGQKPDMKAIDIAKNRSWRPFQLAFVLLNLPSLVDPTHPERSDPTKAFADLLWFPTGGGKTEAYLGAAAFAMGIRRLQREVNGRSGMAGVTVLMRYTLRLLTLQQFQRATTLIAACEVIRRGDPANWGNEPFRIGLWVGQSSTPNWTKDAAEAIKRDRGMWQGKGAGGRGQRNTLSAHQLPVVRPSHRPWQKYPC